MNLRIDSASVLLFSVLVVAGCATGLGKPTKSEVELANLTCTNQINSDRAKRVRNSFRRWLKCKEEQFMPLEIRQYPQNESQIREIYKKLAPVALAVDAGWTSYESFYDQWDAMKSEIDMEYEVCAKRSDGSQKCIPKAGAVLFLKTKDGDVIPYK